MSDAPVHVIFGASGSIVLLSSVAARIGMGHHEAIAAAKGAVVGLAVAAAASHATKDMRVFIGVDGGMGSVQPRRQG